MEILEILQYATSGTFWRFMGCIIVLGIIGGLVIKAIESFTYLVYNLLKSISLLVHGKRKQ